MDSLVLTTMIENIHVDLTKGSRGNDRDHFVMESERELHEKARAGYPPGFFRRIQRRTWNSRRSPLPEITLLSVGSNERIADGITRLMLWQKECICLITQARNSPAARTQEQSTLILKSLGRRKAHLNLLFRGPCFTGSTSMRLMEMMSFSFFNPALSHSSQRLYRNTQDCR